MEPVALLKFAAGLVLLIIGGEVLVRGASRLATAIGISPLVVGLTVVAFGTSSPELAVSVQSALSGQGALALGNIVGSNILNVLLILGLSAVVVPLVVAQRLVRVDVPIMVAVALVVYMLALDGTVSRLDGMLLFAGIVAYIIFAVVQSRRESRQVVSEYDRLYASREPPTPRSVVLNLALIGAGLIALTAGSSWLVDAAVALATALGVSQVIIGLTIVSTP